MKTFPTMSLCAVAAAVVLWIPAVAHAGPVSVTVQVESERDKGDKAKVIQQKTLKITLRNGGREAFEGAKVNYYFFAKDLETKETDVFDEGTEEVSLAPNATAVVDTKTVSATSTGRTRSSKKQKGKPLSPTGDRITGWAVQVKHADKLVGEAYSSPDLKKKLE
jgi:phage-related protein